MRYTAWPHVSPGVTVVWNHAVPRESGTSGGGSVAIPQFESFIRTLVFTLQQLFRDLFSSYGSEKMIILSQGCAGFRVFDRRGKEGLEVRRTTKFDLAHRPRPDRVVVSILKPRHQSASSDTVFARPQTEAIPFQDSGHDSQGATRRLPVLLFVQIFIRMFLGLVLPRTLPLIHAHRVVPCAPLRRRGSRTR
jgi:hypothetical protein